MINFGSRSFLNHRFWKLRIKIRRWNFWSRPKKIYTVFDPDQKKLCTFLIRIKKNCPRFWSGSKKTGTFFDPDQKKGTFFLIQIMRSYDPDHWIMMIWTKRQKKKRSMRTQLCLKHNSRLKIHTKTRNFLGII